MPRSRASRFASYADAKEPAVSTALSTRTHRNQRTSRARGDLFDIAKRSDNIPPGKEFSHDPSLWAGILEGGDTNIRAIGYRKASPALDALEAFETAKPPPEGRDILVEVRAVSVNPIDYKVASGTPPEPGQIKVVGYDAAGLRRQDRRRGCSSRATKFSTPAASAGRGRIRNIIWSTSGSWARSRARSISPLPPPCR